MNFQEFFHGVHQRPALHGLDGSYKDFVTFLLGFDAATSWNLLSGFREWLVVRNGDGNNLVWSALVQRLALPEREHGYRCRPLDPEEDAHAVATLFRLLDEFLELKAEHGGTVKIYDRYLTWLKGQTWFRPETLQ